MTEHRAEYATPHTCIGVDIGGTGTRIGLFSSAEQPDFVPVARFSTQQDYKHQLCLIIEALRSEPRATAIGVSIAGRIAKDGRSVILAPNLPDYLHKPLSDDLGQALGSPVYLAHDTVCGLLGEKKFGSIRADDRCAYLTISTGTGAAFQLRKGDNALTVSIEIGHQLLDGNELVCLCGQMGCLETCTGGRQLELRLGYPTSHISDPTFWSTFSDKLALGLVNLALLTKVEAVAISGAIALNQPFLIPLLQQKVNVRLKWSHLALKPALLGEDAPLIGAATLPDTPQETIIH